MKIHKIPHHKIDFNLYDRCLENSAQYRYSATSTFLNAVAGNQWDIMVLGNYDAVMPIPFVKKMGVKFVLLPKLCQQLGVFSAHDSQVMNMEFHRYLMKNYFVVYYAYNQHNSLPDDFKCRQNFILQNQPYEEAFRKYSPKRKRKLRLEEEVVENAVWRAIPFEEGKDFMLTNMVGHRQEKDAMAYIDTLHALSETGRMYFYAFYYHGEIINALALYQDTNAVALLGTYNVKDKIKLNGSSKLVDFAISEWISQKDFDFEGSDVPSVEEFFRGFRPALFHYPTVFFHKKELLKQWHWRKIGGLFGF